MREVLVRESINDSWLKNKKAGFRPAIARDSMESVRHQQAECSVPCALGIILFISGVFGVAPVAFVRKRDGYHVRMSRGMCFYSYLLFLFLNIGMLYGVVIDLGLPAERSVRARITSARIMWIVELCMLVIMIAVGFCGGPGRMTSMIHSLNQVEKIKSKYSKGSIKESQRMKWFSSVGTTAVVLSAIMLYAFDFFTHLLEALNDDEKSKVVYFYLFFYTLSITMILMELQFITTAFLVNGAFKSVNEVLKDLIYDFDLKNNIPTATDQITTFHTKSINSLIDTMTLQGKTHFLDNIPTATDQITTFHTKSINSLIDTMTLQGKTHFLGIQSSIISPKTFRDLVLSYGTICDVVREIDRSHGLMVLLLLTTEIFHLVITPYYLFVNMKLNPDNAAANLGLQIWFIIFHIMKIVMLTEAGYITQFEMDKTRMLVSHVAGRTDTSDPLLEEVNLFFKQIELNKVGYTPLGMCTLTRPLSASIFGTVTTYLVIVLQFQSLDTN